MNDTLDAFTDDGDEQLDDDVEQETEQLLEEMEAKEGPWPSILDEESSWYSSAHDGEMPSVESVVSNLQDAAWICEGLRALDPERIDQEEHAELVSALKSLRKTVKKTRKEFVEPPLKEDLEEGDRVGTLVVTPLRR